MDLSLIIPLYNEVESIGELVAWITSVCDANQFDFEIVLVDDGSNDGSWKEVERLSLINTRVKGIRFSRNYGKSAALDAGFQKCQGNVVITMDADLQDSPDEIPKLYRMIREDDFDLVSGWKKERHDPISKTIPSKFFNGATRWLTGIKLHDFNCGLKAYKQSLVKRLRLQGEMHRYIPVMAKRLGFGNIGELVVKHQARKYGTTKFGLERFINGFLDLMTIQFITRFGQRPMHLFGGVGTVSFIAGGLVTLWLIAKKIIAISNNTPIDQVRPVTDQPLFYLALTAIIIGVQLFLAGFIAELVSRNNPDQKQYNIDSNIGFD